MYLKPMLKVRVRRLCKPLTVNTGKPLDQVIETLGGMIDLIVDSGETAGGIPSTVVDITVDPLALLRRGPISLESVRRIWENY